MSVKRARLLILATLFVCAIAPARAAG